MGGVYSDSSYSMGSRDRPAGVGDAGMAMGSRNSGDWVWVWSGPGWSRDPLQPSASFLPPGKRVHLQPDGAETRTPFMSPEPVNSHYALGGYALSEPTLTPCHCLLTRSKAILTQFARKPRLPRSFTPSSWKMEQAPPHRTPITVTAGRRNCWSLLGLGCQHSVPSQPLAHCPGPVAQHRKSLWKNRGWRLPAGAM